MNDQSRIIQMSMRSIVKTVITLLSTALISQAVAASDATSDQWKFTIAFPMVWAPDINGKIEGDGNRVDISIPFDQITENLNFGFMGDFYAAKGKWSYVLKLTYLRTEDETVTDGLDAPNWGITIAPQHQIITELQLSANDLLVRYETHKNVLLYTGVRYFFTKVDMDITPLGPGIITISQNINVADEHLFDWLIGISLSHKFNNRWGFMITGDAGLAGDNDRDFSVNAVVAYKINKLNNVWVGYRYLEIGNDTESDGLEFDITFAQQGPMLGWAFTF